MKRYFLILLLLLPFLLSALSVERGNLKIVADDETGGYLCYARFSADSPWYPLLVESFTSSYVQLKLNGEELLPGESRDFSLRFEQSESSLSIIYQGSDLILTETVAILEDLRDTPYFSLSLRLENRGDDTVEAGAKKVLDTSFVKGDTHFIVRGISIKEETAFEKGEIPDSFLSPGSNPGEKLYVHTEFDGYSQPDRLLMVNWNRLDRESWDYNPPDGTNFNALPFSINDSALGFYWLPAPLKKGDSLMAGLAIGPYDFSLEEKESPVPEPVPLPVVISSDPALARLHLEEQLEYLDQFLDEIERLAGDLDSVSNDDILSCEDRLEILEQKKREYETLR